ncbi:MAG: bifunctional UDP-3-O-[3-hydroxymyristoyl] N-acetylglucosamine deacetylase/3-hydroxyacyl-ACP dehydratase [Candidatus Omnitrophota bacterium]|nr:bifunctional UDP-3-O-[3-hydroxymyristoyl] N-acetylglucosamine deacetylase/3-hydroxyacyl-ACP dehydratase [Candidatus Omnitrophota bacterium]
MDSQRTIKKETSLEGVGLHTGNPVKITLKPAVVNSGINFIRVDLPGKPLIKAQAENILDAIKVPRRTSLIKDGAEIHTIEHLMATLCGLGIDNLTIEINNNEVPGLDGSGLVFWEAVRKSGIEEQQAPRRYFYVKEPVLVEEKDAYLAAFPHSNYKISYTLDYHHPLMKAQYLNIELNESSFEKELVASRTFVLEDEVENLKHMGLGRGANYDNTLVVAQKGVKENTLRSEDEFVRHKVLDLIGDLYLLGMPLKGCIIGAKSGHSLNAKLLRKINEQKSHYELGGVQSTFAIKGQELDISQIMKILPHRYPFLMVDRIISIEEGKRAVGIKNVTINESFFQGHFPQKPVMPGVLIIEAMAQVGGVMMLSQEQHLGKIAYFIAANNIKFRKTVVPGDQLVLEAEVVKVKSKTGQVHTQAKVNDKVAAEADLMFILAEA